MNFYFLEIFSLVFSVLAGGNGTCTIPETIQLLAPVPVHILSDAEVRVYIAKVLGLWLTGFFVRVFYDIFTKS